MEKSSPSSSKKKNKIFRKKIFKLHTKNQGDVMSELWQQQKNLTKAAKVLGELKSNLHTRESTAKTKVLF